MELGTALCLAAVISLAHIHASAPSPAQLELVPWSVPPWGRISTRCSGSEDPASNFQPKYIHGQVKPIIPVPWVIILSVLRETACPFQLPGDTGLHRDLLRWTAGFVPEGLSPALFPSPLPLSMHPSWFMFPSGINLPRRCRCLFPGPRATQGDMFNPLVPIAMAMGALCPPPHRLVLNKGLMK